VTRTPAAVRWAVGLSITAAMLVLPAYPALASESIRSYDVQAVVAPDGTLTVTERVAYDYGQDFRRGIIRDIPVESGLPDGTLWIHPTRVDSVTMDGAPVPYEESRDGPYLSLRIGDPDASVTGERTYAITYVVDGALRTMTEVDAGEGNPYGFAPGDVELYWDFIGTAWEVPVTRATVVVTGPGQVLAAQCFTGGFGSTTPCKDRILGESAQFRQDNLFPGEALTVAVAYPGSAFTTAPQRVIEAAPLSRSPGRIFPVAAPLALIVLLATPLTAALMRRRLRGVTIPNSPVQYGPPEDLRPAEIAVGLDGQLESRAVLATLLDLVARRWITLSSQAGGFLRSARINLAWRGEGDGGLRPWEERMANAVFAGREQATLEGYNATFAAAVTSAREELKVQAIAAGRLNARRDSARRWVRAAAYAGVALIIVTAIASLSTENALLYAGLLPIVTALTIGLFIAALFIPPRQIPSSAAFTSRVEGFRRLLDTDPGVARREFVQRLGLPDYAVYATFLPYAVLFDLEGSWSGAFPDLTEEQLNSAGLFIANTAAIHSLMSGATSAVSTASTTPRSSGGSGFSGGGFSGGGGGGGGGRSW